MEENETYTLSKFLDKNYTKPHKIRLSVQDYKEVCQEVEDVLIELSNFEPDETALPDMRYLMSTILVYDALHKYQNAIKYKKINESFEITLPIHICLFLLDLLSFDKQYTSEVRITAGKLDTIIAQNEFSRKFSIGFQISQQLETTPPPPEKVYREPQKLGDAFQKFEIVTTKLLQQHG